MVARDSGTVKVDGRRHVVQRDRTVAHRAHPIVTQHPKLWKELRVHYDMPATGGLVEQATAAPGEVRPVSVLPSERPPTSGRGSGVDAWRAYAAAVTGTSLAEWADKSRDQILAELDGPGDGGQSA